MQLGLAVGEGDFLKADSLYRMLPPPRADTLQYRLLHAYKTGDVATQQALIKRYKTEYANVGPAIAGYRLAHESYEPALARELVQVALQKTKAPAMKARAEAFAAAVELEQGRIASALEHIARSGPNRSTRKFELLSNPFYSVSPERMRAFRDELLESDSVPSGESVAERIKPHVRMYRLAVMSCRMRDFTAAASYAQRLRQIETPEHWRPSISKLANEVEAQIDIENGRVAEGLRKLQSQEHGLALDLGRHFSYATTLPMWHAEALFRLQRYNDAAQWFENMDALFSIEPHAAQILLRRAQIQDALGQSEQARDYYARFLRLWDRADPELQPVVKKARDRLAALQQQVG